MLIKYECKKLFSVLFLIVAFAVILSKPIAQYFTPEKEYVFSKDIYSGYIADLALLETTEQEDYINKETDRINTLMSQKDDMDKDYSNGKITLEHYNAYNSEFLKVSLQRPAFEKITEKYLLYENLSEQGYKTEYFYDLDISTSLNNLRKADYLFFLVVIILVINALSMDKDYGAYDIVRSTAKGRRITAKLISVLIFSFVFSSLICLSDFASILMSNEPSILDKPLSCVYGFSYTASLDISIGLYIIFAIAVKVISGIVTAVLSLSVYIAVKNKLVSVFVTVIIVMLPLLFMQGGIL